MRFFRVLIIIAVLAFPVIKPSYAQTQDLDQSTEKVRRPNVLKLNSFALAFSNISLIYERAIVPRVSAGLGIGYKHAGSLPSILNIDNAIVNSEFGEITGFSITPEARYYLRACDPGRLEGFYAGAYIRYTNYSASSRFEYLPQDIAAEIYNSEVGMTEFGVGIQLGYQMIIKDRLSIDFLFIGPRVSGYKVGYEFDRRPSDEFLADLSNAINEVIDQFGLDYEVDIESEGSAEASSTFSFVNARVGLSIGYTF